MANELRQFNSSGLTVIVKIINSIGKFWNGSSFESYILANDSTYRISLIEQGASGIYYANMPSAITDAGLYEYFGYRISGTTLTPIGTGTVNWTGTAVISSTDETAIDTTIALITLAEMKQYLQITSTAEDSFLSLLINQMSEAVNSYTGRYLLQKMWTEYHDIEAYGVENFTGRGLFSRGLTWESNRSGFELIVSQYPIISVTSLYDDIERVFSISDLISTNDYFVDKGSGIIRLNWNVINFMRGRANIKVTYSAGYPIASVPGSIKIALKRWAAVQYKKYKSGRHEIQSESIGDKHTTYFDKEIPNDVAMILSPYLRNGDSPTFVYND